MTSKCFEKCGDVFKRNIAGILVVIMGISSVAAIFSLFIRW